LQYGFRNIGNVGSRLDPVDPDNGRLYWGLYFFNLSFFLIIFIMFFVVIIGMWSRFFKSLGLVSSTFNHLRQLQQTSDDDYDRCWICGSTKDQFKAK
jgi:hypothetical protein